MHITNHNLGHRGAFRVRDVKVNFTAPEPFWMATNKTRHSESISSSPDTFTISTIGGNTFSRPIITVTNDGSNISSLQLENRTTGQLWAYSGTIVTGQSLVIDTDLLTVENNDVDDIANFSGDFDMYLLPEDNEIYVLGLVSGTVIFDWYDRWF